MKLLFLCGLVMSMLIITGCQRSKAPKINIHQNPKRNLIPVDDIQAQRISSFDFEKERSNLGSYTLEEASNKIFQPLLKNIDDIGFPAESSKEHEEILRKSFSLLAASFSQFLKSTSISQWDETSKKSLQTYQDYMLSNCKSDGVLKLENCLNLQFFRSVPETILFIESYLSHVEDISSYYTLIDYGYALNIAQSTSNLDLLFVKRSKEYESAYRDDSDALQKHLEIHSLILSRSRVSPILLASYDTDYKNYENLFSNENESRKKVFALWLDKTLDSDLVEVPQYIQKLTENLSIAAEASENQSLDIQDTFKATSLGNPQHLQELGLPSLSSIPSSLHLRIFDTLADESTSESLKINLVKLISLNTQKQVIAEQILTYAKFSLLALSLESSKKLAGFFLNHQRDEAERPSRKKLLQRALDEADRLSPKWSRFIAKIQSIKTTYKQFFANELLENRPNNSFQTNLADLESIPRNINYYVTFPNMMLIIYYLANEDFSLRMYQLGRGVVTIDVKDIINVFFDGQYAPWFDFGTGTRLGVEYFELEQVFYYSLFFGLFETYKIDPSAYFQVMIDKLLRPGITKVQEGYQLLQSQFEGNEKYNDFLATCRFHGKAVCADKPDEYKICKSTSFLESGRSYPLKSNSWDLLNYTFAGLPGRIMDSKQNQPINSIGIHPSFMTGSALYWLPGKKWLANAANLDEFLEKIRVDFKRRLVQIKRLSRVTSLYLAKFKGQEAAENFDKRIVEQLEYTEKEIQNYLGKTLKWDAEVTLCTSLFVNLEVKTQKILTKMEESYLTDVHRVLKAHHSNPKSDDQLKAALFPKHNSYSNIQGYDELISDTLTQIKSNQSIYPFYYPLIILRLREYLLSEQFPINGMNQRNINLPKSIEEFEFDGEVDLSQVNVNFSGDSSQFRKNVFDSYSFLANKDGKAWFKYSPFAWFIRDWIRFKAMTIKLGEIETNTSSSPALQSGSCPNQTGKYKACIEDLLSFNLDFNNILLPNESNFETLELIYKDRFVHQELYLHRVFMEYELGSTSSILNYYGPLERLFHFVKRPYGGDTGDRDQYKSKQTAKEMPRPIRRRDIFKDGKRFFLYNEQKPNMVFPVPQWLTQEIESYYQTTVAKEIAHISETSNKILERQQMDQEADTVQKLIWVRGTESTSTSYIGSKAHEFEKFLETFHRQTKDYYKE